MDETKLITVYCLVDEFINMVMNYPVGKLILGQWQGKCGPKR
jgi:hypothetical protein